MSIRTCTSPWKTTTDNHSPVADLPPRRTHTSQLAALPLAESTHHTAASVSPPPASLYDPAIRPRLGFRFACSQYEPTALSLHCCLCCSSPQSDPVRLAHCRGATKLGSLRPTRPTGPSRYKQATTDLVPVSSDTAPLHRPGCLCVARLCRTASTPLSAVSIARTLAILARISSWLIASTRPMSLAPNHLRLV